MRQRAFVFTKKFKIVWSKFFPINKEGRRIMEVINNPCGHIFYFENITLSLLNIRVKIHTPTALYTRLLIMAAARFTGTAVKEKTPIMLCTLL